MLNQMSVVKEVKNVIEELYNKNGKNETLILEVKNAINSLSEGDKTKTQLMSEIRTKMCATTNLVAEALKKVQS